MIKECNFKIDEICLLKEHLYINPRDVSLKGFNGRCNGEENCVLFQTYKKLHEDKIDNLLKELKKYNIISDKKIGD